MEIFMYFFIAVLNYCTKSAAALPSSSSSLGKNEETTYPPFGHKMRQEFFLKPDLVYLNHGSYGTYPKYVQQALHKFQSRSEAHPDLWLRREVKGELQKVRTLLGDLVKAAAEDIVMVPNTTSGINAIFRSIVFQFGDRILYFSTIYNAMLSLIHYIADYSKGAVEPLEFNATYPTSNDALVSKLDKFLDDEHIPGKLIRVAIIDHISSTPGVVVPIDRIIPLLKQRNITVIIDGSHAIGQVPINLNRLSPDFYVTDCHKWLYAARGCAMLYVDKIHQSMIHPAIVSVNYSPQGNFQKEFYWTGTMDFSNYMTVTAALEFRKSIGGYEAIYNYNHNLAIEGGKYLAKFLQTEVLQNEEQIGYMVDVRLPLDNPDDKRLTFDFFLDEFFKRATVYVLPHKHDGKWWARSSAQIYTELGDFEVAAVFLKNICEEINNNFTKSNNLK